MTDPGTPSQHWLRSKRVIAACLVLLAAAACTPKASPSNPPPPPPPPSSDSPTVSVNVVAPSQHITGSYPAHCVARGALPDPGCTPGAVTSNINEGNIESTICVTGWTKTVRPPESESEPMKRTAMIAYGLPANAASTTELDHLVPLELGGANSVGAGVGNLWPERSDIPNAGWRNTKDEVESKLRAAVCAHRVDLTRAQELIATDWTTALAQAGVG